MRPGGAREAPVFTRARCSAAPAGADVAFGIDPVACATG